MVYLERNLVREGLPSDLSFPLETFVLLRHEVKSSNYGSPAEKDLSGSGQ